MPVLTRAGCNQGGCHGAASGKGGFKLSLLGYDPESDYDAIAHWGGGRRVTRTHPENSLLLRKPTLTQRTAAASGSKSARPNTECCAIGSPAGMPAPAADEPHVVSLEVLPAVRTLAKGQSQQFLVRARYNDGSRRDATARTLFTAHDKSVTTVTPDGTATMVAPGEGAVVIRYQGLVATARLVSPFSGIQAFRRSGVQGHRPEHLNTRTPERLNAVDRLVDEKLAALGLEASGRCKDAQVRAAGVSGYDRAAADTGGGEALPLEPRAGQAGKADRRSAGAAGVRGLLDAEMG